MDESDIDVIESVECAVLKPRGYLNGDLGERLEEACLALVSRGNRNLVVSFRETETVNTTGISSLVSALEKVSRRGGFLCLSDLGVTNRQVLDVLDLSRAVLIFETEDEARRHLTRNVVSRG